MAKKSVLLCVVCSLMFCFLMIGHASLSTTLDIQGTTEVDIPSGLFIIGMERVGSPTDLDVYQHSYVQYSTTASTSLSKSQRSRAGSITYEITVLNNTSREYAYRGLYYQPQASGYHNNMIVESTQNANTKIAVVTSFPNGKVVGPGETLTFNVTYTLGSSTTVSRNTTYKTLINYQFGINVESEADAVDAVHEKFLDILNTSSTYDTLVDVLDNKFDGRQEWTSNYVGNVGDATSDDAMTVNTLFAGQLSLVINGQTKKATVLIKHENLDNNQSTGDDYVAINTSNGGRFEGRGCEMTLYLTTDDLNRANSNAPVYVTVFTCDRDANGNIVGDWYKIGETYQGKAPVVSYNGTEGGTGSFVTDKWVADAATYKVTEQYSYTVAQGTTIKTLVQTVDARMTQEFQSLLDQAKAMIDDTTYAGTGITVVEDAYKRAAAYYTLDANGNPVANAYVTRAQLCPIVQDLEHNLQIAKDKIDEIQGQN